MDVKRVFWFNSGISVIGIVVGEDNVTKRRKAYIGTAHGDDEASDTKHIASHGSPFTAGNVAELNELLNPPGV